MILIPALLCALGLAAEPAELPEPPDAPPPVEEGIARVEPAVDPFEQPLLLMDRVTRNGYPHGGTLLAVVALEQNPDHPRAPLVRLEIARYQRVNGLFLEEEKTLARGLEAHPARWKPWFELALMDAELQRQDFRSIADAHEGRAEWPAEVSDAALFYGAWGRAGSGDDAGAQVLLAKVRGGLEPAAREFSEALEEGPGRSRRPAIAGLLSLIPGAGHAYAADPTGAAANTLVTGGLGATGVYFYTHDEPVLGAVFGILGGASLVAGIGDAMRQAQSFNRVSQIERFDKLASRWWLRSTLTSDDQRPVEVSIQPFAEQPGWKE